MESLNLLTSVAVAIALLTACDSSPGGTSGAPATGQGDQVGPVAIVEFDGETYELVPSEQTAARVESAMPGTSDIPDQLRLRPPDVRFPDQVYQFEDDGRDYLPDPFAEFVVDVALDEPTEVALLDRRLTPAAREALGYPSFFAHDVEDGRWTFLISADGPTRVDALKLAYRLAADSWDGETPEARLSAIQSGVALVPEFLDRGGIGHTLSPPALDTLPERFRIGQSISQIDGNYITTVLVAPEGQTFDGSKVWTVLHSAGLPWGDMDHFHWPDPTLQADYLFDVWVDDGNYGYALPELIASGEQDFISLAFAFNIARSPDPNHVYREMQRAVDFTRDRLGGFTVYLLDDQFVMGPEDHLAAIETVTEFLASHGLRPGQSAVLRLN